MVANLQPLGKLLDGGGGVGGVGVRTISVWANPGFTQSPVSICFDDRGNLFVAETERAGNAVNDTRNLGHLNAVEEDLKFRTVEDRRAQIKRWVASGAFEKDYFTRTQDRIRIVRDRSGSGVADWSGVFADGFRDEVDGIGAGVLFHKNRLYYTCIPSLWALTPAADRLVATGKESLAYGFGVRWCFFGHDLHGLVAGPDGRIYFSMGDRGYNITTKEGVNIFGPDRGGIFRCWPDGSGLELIHDGLRNPQELAFDELGDLFTGDNNCDSGDRARLVYVCEGGDSGWRQDVQSLPSRGPWNREFMWNVRRDKDGPERPAWSVPPVEYVGNGPSGLTMIPGTGEAADLRGRLLMVDFYGSGAAVHMLKLASVGAEFVVKDHRDYFRGEPTITDIAWGPDSRLYLSDWGGGWSPNPNGRVLVIENTGVRADAKGDVERVRVLLTSDLSVRPQAELLGLLADPDQRVRLRAQESLVAAGRAAVAPLCELAAMGEVPRFARLHAIWALGQLARTDADAARGLVPLLRDSDAEVRNHAIRTLGDQRTGDAGREVSLSAKAGLIAAMSDPASRVRASASLAAGKLGLTDARLAIFAVLESNAGADRVLADAASAGLSRLGEPALLTTMAKDMGPSARLGAVVALRKIGTREAADSAAFFLMDASPAVAVEAARCVYDTLPAFDASPQQHAAAARSLTALASLIERPLPADRAIEPLLRRAIEANVRLGDASAATRLIGLAASNVPEEFRLLALSRVQNWDRPLAREGVWGNWVSIPARAKSEAQNAIRAALPGVLASQAPATVLTKARELEARFMLTPAQMASRLEGSDLPETEVVALLNELTSRDASQAVKSAAGILDRGVTGLGRSAAEKLLVTKDLAAATPRVIERARSGPLADRQRSIELLGTLDEPRARGAVAALAREMVEDTHDDGAALEIYRAAMAQPDGSEAKAAVKPLGLSGKRPEGYADGLLRAGGNASLGRDIFYHHPAAECLRCHIVHGEGGTAPTTSHGGTQASQAGGTAGPNLSQVGLRLSRGKLIESICEPDAEVAKGYGATSAMPVMTQFLSPADVRNVVEFLTTLRGTPTGKEARTPAESVDERTPARRAVPMAIPIIVVGLGVVLLWKAVSRRG